MRVLVTGGKGYVGSAVTQILQIPYDVYDIRDGNDIRDMNIDIQEYDCILFLSAIVGDPSCLVNPQYASSVNIKGLINILEHMTREQKIVFLSSTSVYGDQSTDIKTEKSNLTLIQKNIYASHKITGEQLVKAYTDNYCILRPVSAFGVIAIESFRLDLLVHSLIYSALTDNEIILYEPNIKRQCIHISDFAQIIALAITDLHGIYNVGNSSLDYTKGDTASLIAHYTGCKLDIIQKTSNELRDYPLSFEKIENVYTCQVHSFNQTIEDMKKHIEYIKQNREKLDTVERTKRYIYGIHN